MRAMNTQRSWLRPCTLVYLAMMGLTFVTFGIGMAGLSGLEVSLTVLVFALIKGQILGDYFMGLKAVRGIWRRAIFLWLFILGALIAIAFWLAD